MKGESLFTEGDINQSALREKWETRHDTETKEWLDADAKYFLHQSLSSGSGTATDIGWGISPDYYPSNGKTKENML